MKYSISPFIKILFVTLIILITFPTHLLAYTSNSNPLSSTEDDFDLQPGDIILTKEFYMVSLVILVSHLITIPFYK